MNRKAGIFLLCLCIVAVLVGIAGNLRTDEDPVAKEAGELPAQEEVQAEPQESVQSSANVTPMKYVLLDEEGQVVVFHSDRETVYMNTGIVSAQLPETVQKHLSQGIGFTTEEELFAFLESYSS